MRPFEPRVFASPPAPRALLMERGNGLVRLSVRPWVLGVGAAFLSLALLASAGSTALFLMSDDVASAFRAREARTVSAYEQRIADLRRELDRVTSREHSERRTVALKVETILDRQRQIEERFERIDPLLAQARSTGLIEAAIPLPSARPGDAQPAAHAFAPADPSAGAAAFEGFTLRTGETGSGWRDGSDGTPDAERLLQLGAEVEAIEKAQRNRISMLAERAMERAARIRAVLAKAGMPGSEEAEGVGGPFIPAPGDAIERLSDALSALGEAHESARALPLAAPVEGARLSSNFGIRRDPFLGRRALHAGVDYAAVTGTPVLAGADGTVVRAGRNGGYGLMVEIDHGGGHVTRYAHLSAIEVEPQQKIAAGEVLGRVGSTGRSTGPHLHYEVQRAGKAVDPMRYLEAGRKLETLL